MPWTYMSTEGLKERGLFLLQFYYGITGTNPTYLGCTMLWLDLHIHCEMIATIKLINIYCLPSFLCMCVCGETT